MEIQLAVEYSKFSLKSPWALGHKVGDRVEVKVNEKVSYYVVIKSIENTGEEETDTIRTF